MNDIHVALVSMPWASVWIPSIQLAVLRRCLAGRAVVESHEVYVDFAARISPSLYKRLSESLGFAEEWVFGANYFPDEGMPYATPYPELDFPPLGIAERAREKELLWALSEVAGDFLDELAEGIDWSHYDLVAFTLTISQTAASMALARRIKLRHPNVKIVFGGSSCAGPPAEAMLRICPYVDVVVRGEAEPVFANLVERLASGLPLDGIPGITSRVGDEIESSPGAGLVRLDGSLSEPDFNEYFGRLRRLGLGTESVMLPFESSRGCWWGQKSQCTFCGLHETMEYRDRDHLAVLRELDWLYKHYGIGRFFATDLIMPYSYYDSLLPALAESDRNYEFYYELKANTTREKVKLLADAGVRLVQPGLESLSTAVLRLIRKGCTGTQNVAFLKWAGEYGLEVSWNIIIGTPGEDPAENAMAAEAMPSLWHLPPPFAVEFELTRFSPVFQDPASFGISKVEPVSLYFSVFPVSRDLLCDLVYRFSYESEDFGGPPPWMTPGAALYCPELHQAIDDWREAHARGAELYSDKLPGGGLRIVDTRIGQRKEWRLTPAECTLYTFLDAPRIHSQIPTLFATCNPETAMVLGGAGAIEGLLRRWAAQRLVFIESDEIVAVATTGPAAQETNASDLEQEVATH